MTTLSITAETPGTLSAAGDPPHGSRYGVGPAYGMLLYGTSGHSLGISGETRGTLTATGSPIGGSVYGVGTYGTRTYGSVGGTILILTPASVGSLSDLPIDV